MQPINLPPSPAIELTKPFVRSFGEGFQGIPGHHGVAERCLGLVQLADKQQNGSALEKIAVSTLPTNERYAAIYQPHVCRDWAVIALDWGFICGLWGIPSAFALCAPIAGNGDPKNGIILCFDEQRLIAGVRENRDDVRQMLTTVLVPCILMGKDPPYAAAINDPIRLGTAGVIFNAMMFIVVAHEYSHLRRGHTNETQASQERRHAMEMEADGMALALGLTNPWMAFDREAGWMAGLTASVQCLVLSFIRMLEMGDKMMERFGSDRKSMRTHPPAEQRLMATQFLLLEILNIGRDAKESINQSRRGLTGFGDEAWNLSVGSIGSEIRDRAQADAKIIHALPRNAELKFL